MRKLHILSGILSIVTFVAIVLLAAFKAVSIGVALFLMILMVIFMSIYITTEDIGAGKL